MVLKLFTNRFFFHLKHLFRLAERMLDFKVSKNFTQFNSVFIKCLIEEYNLDHSYCAGRKRKAISSQTLLTLFQAVVRVR